MITSLKIKAEILDKNIIKSALLRLNYLMPYLEFSYENNEIGIISKTELPNTEINEIKKNVNYVLYKEKIYEENKLVRAKIYNSF